MLDRLTSVLAIVIFLGGCPSATTQHVASLELVKLDAIHTDEPISSHPREILWRGGRSSDCGT